eukprot:1570461-Heterocapsa_arctica.AAC.1
MEGGIPQGSKRDGESMRFTRDLPEGQWTVTEERSGILDGMMLGLAVLWMKKESPGRLMSGL